MNQFLLAAVVFSSVMMFTLGLRERKKQRSGWQRRVDPARFALEEGEMLSRRSDDEFAPKHRGWLGALEAEARRAGMNVTLSQLLAVALGAGAIMGGLMYTLVPIPSIAIATSFLGLLAPRLWIARRRAKRAEQFSRALEGALNIMAQSLRAGSSLAQAVIRAADQSDEPVRSELMRAANVIKMGTPVEALSIVSKRVDSPDWELVVVAVEVLEQTGGDLAEVFDQIRDTIRQRRLAREAIRTQTTNNRMTGMLLSILPILVVFMVRIISPDYFAPMLSSPVGVMVFVGCFFLIGLGFLWVRNLTNVPVD